MEIISISVDSQFVHKVWNDTELLKMVGYDVPFYMASDGGGTIGTVYGVYSPTQGVDFRGRFLIDPDGIIQAMEILAPSVGRNVDETLRQIQAFQLVRKAGGKEVTPSGWTPGCKVLTPGPDLVANVWKEWNPKDMYGKK